MMIMEVFTLIILLRGPYNVSIIFQVRQITHFIFFKLYIFFFILKLGIVLNINSSFICLLINE